MISALIAGFSLLLFSGLANTYISYMLLGEISDSNQKNDLPLK
ncbi:hypothetical protein [Iningainema tapete]|nr:hypothetical protein [Iningainema tapete]